ncbi:MAG TPA: hypothetical protein VNW92_08590 [Polyangiaceae bacterium]|nr:hypothetical protein [Polyangiaceae bacterium]
MQTRVVQLLLMGFGVGCLVACSVPETAATSRNETGQGERDIRREQRAVERRRERIQKQILSDLRALKDGRNAPGGGTEPASDQTAEPAAYKLLIFGGASHEVYLGCLCEGQESVFNLTGEFGSDLSENSVRNKFAPYGSNSADTSACNPAATHPPSVVASDGESLGLLTLNTSLKKRIVTPSVTDWLTRMCSL